MPSLKHIDFEPADWGEFASPPSELPSYADQVLALNPASYWRLGETQGSIAVDLANTRPGTYSASVGLDQPGSLFRDPDRAAILNGVDGSISVPGNDLFNAATACSVLFWMKYEAASVVGDAGVLGRWPNPSRLGWLIWVDRIGLSSQRPNTLSFAPNTTTGDDGKIEGSANLITPGVWDFYALTFVGGDTTRLYKNGKLDTVANATFSTMPSTNLPTWIGRTGGAIGHLPASLDEVAVFNHALTADQIGRLYALGRGQLPNTGAAE